MASTYRKSWLSLVIITLIGSCVLSDPVDAAGNANSCKNSDQCRRGGGTNVGGDSCYVLTSNRDPWSKTFSACNSLLTKPFRQMATSRLATFKTGTMYREVMFCQMASVPDPKSCIWLGAQAQSGETMLSSYKWMTDANTPGSPLTSVPFPVTIEKANGAPFCIYVLGTDFNVFYADSCDNRRCYGLCELGCNDAIPPAKCANEVCDMTLNETLVNPYALCTTTTSVTSTLSTTSFLTSSASSLKTTTRSVTTLTPAYTSQETTQASSTPPPSASSAATTSDAKTTRFTTSAKDTSSSVISSASSFVSTSMASQTSVAVSTSTTFSIESSSTSTFSLSETTSVAATAMSSSGSKTLDTSTLSSAMLTSSESTSTLLPKTTMKSTSVMTPHKTTTTAMTTTPTPETSSPKSEYLTTTNSIIVASSTNSLATTMTEPKELQTSESVTPSTVTIMTTGRKRMSSTKNIKTISLPTSTIGNWQTSTTDTTELATTPVTILSPIDSTSASMQSISENVAIASTFAKSATSSVSSTETTESTTALVTSLATQSFLSSLPDTAKANTFSSSSKTEPFSEEINTTKVATETPTVLTTSFVLSTERKRKPSTTKNSLLTSTSPQLFTAKRYSLATPPFTLSLPSIANTTAVELTLIPETRFPLLEKVTTLGFSFPTSTVLNSQSPQSTSLSEMTSTNVADYSLEPPLETAADSSATLATAETMFQKTSETPTMMPITLTSLTQLTQKRKTIISLQEVSSPTVITSTSPSFVSSSMLPLSSELIAISTTTFASNEITTVSETAFDSVVTSANASPQHTISRKIIRAASEMLQSSTPVLEVNTVAADISQLASSGVEGPAAPALTSAGNKPCNAIAGQDCASTTSSVDNFTSSTSQFLLSLGVTEKSPSTLLAASTITEISPSVVNANVSTTSMFAPAPVTTLLAANSDLTQPSILDNAESSLVVDVASQDSSMSPKVSVDPLPFSLQNLTKAYTSLETMINQFSLLKSDSTTIPSTSTLSSMFANPESSDLVSADFSVTFATTGNQILEEQLTPANLISGQTKIIDATVGFEEQQLLQSTQFVSITVATTNIIDSVSEIPMTTYSNNDESFGVPLTPIDANGLISNKTSFRNTTEVFALQENDFATLMATEMSNTDFSSIVDASQEITTISLTQATGAIFDNDQVVSPEPTREFSTEITEQEEANAITSLKSLNTNMLDTITQEKTSTEFEYTTAEFTFRKPEGRNLPVRNIDKTPVLSTEDITINEGTTYFKQFSTEESYPNLNDGTNAANIETALPTAINSKNDNLLVTAPLGTNTFALSQAFTTIAKTEEDPAMALENQATLAQMEAAIMTAATVYADTTAKSLSIEQISTTTEWPNMQSMLIQEVSDEPLQNENQENSIVSAVTTLEASLQPAFTDVAKTRSEINTFVDTSLEAAFAFSSPDLQIMLTSTGINTIEPNTEENQDPSALPLPTEPSNDISDSFTVASASSDTDDGNQDNQYLSIETSKGTEFTETSLIANELLLTKTISPNASADDQGKDRNNDANATNPCQMSDWSSYSACSATCGQDAVMVRSRKFNHPNSPYTTNKCPPAESDVVPCFLPKCNPMSLTEKLISKIQMNIGCCWLTISLALSIAASIIRKSKTYLPIIHLCEDISLLGCHIIVVSGADRDEKTSQALCSFASVALQYFYIVSFAFQFMEALFVYSVLTSVTTGNDHIIGLKMTLGLCLGVPAIITAGTAASSYNRLMSDFSCWLNVGNGPVFLATFVPVLAMAIPTVILLEAAGVERPGASPENALSCRIARGSLGMIFATHFLSWCLGTSALYYQHIFLFTSIFGLNVTLGVLIFMFHLLADHNVRIFIKKWYGHIMEKLRR